MSLHSLKEKKSFLADYVVFVTFIILSVLGLLSHEMSETEMQNWVVANESNTLRDFWYNMRYEPHPYFWHTILFLVTKIYPHYLAAQLLHLLINATAIFLIFKFSPFAKWYNWIFAFGYFPFYEYNLITRNYALTFLFIVLFLVLFRHRHAHYFVLFLVAGLLANTHMYGLVMSLGFIGITMIDYLRTQHWNLYQKRQFWIGCFSYVVIIAGTIYYTRLPDDSILSIDTTHSLSFGRIGEAILGVWKSMLPVPRFFEEGFWNTNYFSSIYPPLFVFLSAILYAFLLMMFLKKPVAMALFLTTSLGFLLMFFISKTMEMRHFGFLFLSFFASLWIASFYDESNFLKWRGIYSQIEATVKRLSKSLLILLLFVQLLSGAIFYFYDLSAPFSQAKNVVRYLQHERSSNKLIAVDRYHVIPAITGYLDKSVYCLVTEKQEKFLIWNNDKRKILNEAEIIKSIDRLAAAHDGEIIVILNYALQTSAGVSLVASNFRFDLLRKFEGSLCRYENFYAYSVSKQ